MKAKYLCGVNLEPRTGHPQRQLVTHYSRFRNQVTRRDGPGGCEVGAAVSLSQQIEPDGRHWIARPTLLDVGTYQDVVNPARDKDSTHKK
jgi:hypothetical protein